MKKVVNLKAPNKLLNALEIMKRELPELLEYQRVIAKLRKASYDGLIEEGFSKEEALELCKINLL